MNIFTAALVEHSGGADNKQGRETKLKGGHFCNGSKSRAWIKTLHKEKRRDLGSSPSKKGEGAQMPGNKVFVKKPERQKPRRKNTILCSRKGGGIRPNKVRKKGQGKKKTPAFWV